MSSSNLNNPHPSYLSQHRNSIGSDSQRNASHNHNSVEYFGHHYAKSEEEYKYEMMALRNIPHKTTSQLVDQMDCVKHVVNMQQHGSSRAKNSSSANHSHSNPTSSQRRSTGNLNELITSPKQQHSAHHPQDHHQHHKPSSDHKSPSKKH
ncbi:hypothetical protein FDP41_007189 [Naegleria fowleri]|uniref:Uncharacterized protein n=1 Tax=Naegleria fowleri TaxID=5763 RepID=A0A6A5BG87_NAEFO|nr:uncharacterized protein FDP41_007189 [Naegleria fowleri]KAF0973802.1 hypothetical protein FDP41_007189 [Naegleria fowleri]